MSSHRSASTRTTTLLAGTSPSSRSSWRHLARDPDEAGAIAMPRTRSRARGQRNRDRGAGRRRGPCDKVLAGSAGTRSSANADAASPPGIGGAALALVALPLRNDLASQAAIRPDYRNDRGAGVSAENLSDLLFGTSATDVVAGAGAGVPRPACRANQGGWLSSLVSPRSGARDAAHLGLTLPSFGRKQVRLQLCLVKRRADEASHEIGDERGGRDLGQDARRAHKAGRRMGLRRRIRVPAREPQQGTAPPEMTTHGPTARRDGEVAMRQGAPVGRPLEIPDDCPTHGS